MTRSRRDLSPSRANEPPISSDTTREIYPIPQQMQKESSKKSKTAMNESCERMTFQPHSTAYSHLKEAGLSYHPLLLPFYSHSLLMILTTPYHILHTSDMLETPLNPSPPPVHTSPAAP